MDPLDGSPLGGKPVTGAIVFGSDHGLCGRFNEALAAHVGAMRRESSAACRVMAVGVRQAAALEEQGLNPEQRFYTRRPPAPSTRPCGGYRRYWSNGARRV